MTKKIFQGNPIDLKYWYFGKPGIGKSLISEKLAHAINNPQTIKSHENKSKL